MSRHTYAVRLLIAAAITVSAAACEKESPLTPTPTPTPRPQPLRSVFGTVVEFRASGERVPVANLRLQVRWGESSGAVGATPRADVVTDAEGRYRLNDISWDPVFFQPAPGSEYRSLCDWYPISGNQYDVNLLADVPVVHRTWSGDRPPQGMWFWAGGPWGTVSEQIDGRLQPVSGATVLLDGGRPDGPATTDPNGFYMICTFGGGLETGQPARTVEASKPGYNSVTRDDSGGNPVNIQLTRK
jgi:hypothetical protein